MITLKLHFQELLNASAIQKNLLGNYLQRDLIRNNVLSHNVLSSMIK